MLQAASSPEFTRQLWISLDLHGYHGILKNSFGLCLEMSGCPHWKQWNITLPLEIIEAMAISDVRLSLLKYQCYAFFFYFATSHRDLEGFLRGGNHP